MHSLITCMLVTIDRPKKKRSPPAPVAVSPEATATPPISAPIPAPPSPPAIAAKTKNKVNYATPPSNQDTDIATTVEDDTKDVTMSIDDIINATSREQVKDHSATTEPVIPSEPPVVESVKNETVKEKVPSPLPLSPPPSPPKPVELVVATG